MKKAPRCSAQNLVCVLLTVLAATSACEELKGPVDVEREIEGWQVIYNLEEVFEGFPALASLTVTTVSDEQAGLETFEVSAQDPVTVQPVIKLPPGFVRNYGSVIAIQPGSGLTITYLCTVSRSGDLRELYFSVNAFFSESSSPVSEIWGTGTYAPPYLEDERLSMPKMVNDSLKLLEVSCGL